MDPHCYGIIPSKLIVWNFLKILFSFFLFIAAVSALLRPFREYLEVFPWRWILLTVGVVLVGLLSFAAYRLIKVRSQNRKLNEERWRRIAPLQEAIESSRGINEDDVRPFAFDLATRWVTLDLLQFYELKELFPPEIYTVEQLAMGNLASWLEFPTELDAIPDEIEHFKLVSIDFDDEGNKALYHVYRFRIDEPHWAAERGWMLGVVGPYFDDSEPDQFPQGTFSRLSKEGEISPEDEAQWVHENISMRAVG